TRANVSWAPEARSTPKPPPDPWSSGGFFWVPPRGPLVSPLTDCSILKRTPQPRKVRYDALSLFPPIHPVAPCVLSRRGSAPRRLQRQRHWPRPGQDSRPPGHGRGHPGLGRDLHHAAVPESRPGKLVFASRHEPLGGTADLIARGAVDARRSPRHLGRGPSRGR